MLPSPARSAFRASARRGSLPGLFLACILFMAGEVRAQSYESCQQIHELCDPALCGSWSGVYDWSATLDPDNCPLGTFFQEISHAALIVGGQHAGKVFHWRQAFGSNCSPTSKIQFWLFNPQNPGQIEKLKQELTVDYFCAAMGWDRNVRLTVAGGFPFGGTGPAPREAFRFDPRLLRDVDYSTTPPSVPGTALLTDPAFLLSIARYYAGITSLDRRPITPHLDCVGLTIPGGSQVVFGGPPTISNEGNELWQFLDPMAPLATAFRQTLVLPTGTFTGQHAPALGSTIENYTLSSAFSTPPLNPSDALGDSYPRGMQLSDPGSGGLAQEGRIFVAFDVDTAAPANTPGLSWVMKTPLAMAATTGCWELDLGGSSNAPVVPGGVSDRQYAPAVIMHTILLKNRVLAFGGSQLVAGSWQVHDNVQEYDLSPAGIPQFAESGKWRDKASLLSDRHNHHAILLATGHILILGGESERTLDTECCLGAVFFAELYDPGAGPTDFGASHPLAWDPNAIPRRYHHVALLQLDGSVLIMGGRQRPGCPPAEHTGQIFRPPYFDNGTRPVIDAAPGAISFNGAPFTVQVTLFHQSVHRVVLLRPGAVTHHFDSDQRYIELLATPDPYVPDPNGVQVNLTVTPPEETLGPPGAYTLWVVESKATGGAPAYHDLIPSQAKVVLIN